MVEGQRPVVCADPGVFVREAPRLEIGAGGLREADTQQLAVNVGLLCEVASIRAFDVELSHMHLKPKRGQPRHVLGDAIKGGVRVLDLRSTEKGRPASEQRGQKFSD